MAGQRAHLTLECGAATELPIASCPCNARNLLFFVRETPADPFAAAVFSGELHHGQLITVTGPRGHFVLHEDSPEPAVFIAFGDGIAPIKSLIEHAVSIDTIDSFHLYWAVSGPEGQYQARWCRAMKESLDNFAYTPLVDVSTADLMAVLTADHPDPAGLRWYVAGPQAAAEALAEGLRRLGVEEERVAVEGF
jgi:CDP-4-dehydro-6-deoxyglucose reductase